MAKRRAKSSRSIRLSAFVEDMRVSHLPRGVQQEVKRFISPKQHHLVSHYGMVTKELVGKADPHNLKAARAAVKDLSPESCAKQVKQSVRKGSKYVLVLNDRIVDGHHFLAKAERGGVSSSLNVLDLTPSRFQLSAYDGYMPPPQKQTRSKLRTAGILAGGAGLAYAGVKVGNAAGELSKTAQEVRGHARALAPVVHAAAVDAGSAARNAAVAAGAVAAPFNAARAMAKKLRKVFRLSMKAKPITLARPPVAADRYSKQIKEADENRASGNYKKSAVLGAVLGALLSKSGRRSNGALNGAAAGVAAQGVVRAGTAETKDQFGDRSSGGKKVDKLVPALLTGGVLVAAHRRLKKIGFSAAGSVGSVGSVGSKAMGLLRNKRFLTGAALAGGITAADVVTSTAFPDAGSDRKKAALHGLGKGAVYGTALAGAEPFLHKALISAARKMRSVSLARRLAGVIQLVRLSRKMDRVIELGGQQQLLDDSGRFLNPLNAVSGTPAYHRDEKGDLNRTSVAAGHAQVLRSAFNEGRKLQKVGSRAGSFVRDVSDSARGVSRIDERGRARKKEWEKSWFKNAAGSALLGAALIGHHTAIGKNPRYRKQVGDLVTKAKSQVNSVVPDWFPEVKGKLRQMSAKLRAIRLDITAPEWDVRDQRGRSARVFAPGSRQRERRPKEWHEKADNQRKLAVAGALAAAIAGTALGYKLRGAKPAAAAVAKPMVAKVIPFPKHA